jgi:glycosyltransferase involved in cell wall biosynthesis
MRLIYVLLSSTFGMHQYTADLANRMADCRFGISVFPIGNSQSAIRPAPVPERSRDNPGVVLITTTSCPRDRYSPAVRIETPIAARGTGFSREGLDWRGYHRVLSAMDPARLMQDIDGLSRIRAGERSARGPQPDAIVHFTGVHLWNPPLVRALRRRGIPVIHTLHDLHPHRGVRFGGLIGLWNRLIIASGAHILVHARCSRDELLARGVPRERVTCTSLLHGFWGYETGVSLTAESRRQPAIDQECDSPPEEAPDCGLQTPYAIRPTPYAIGHAPSAISPTPSAIRLTPSAISHQPSPIRSTPSALRHAPSVLFFGRLESYKGLDVLLSAWAQASPGAPGARLLIAGPPAAEMALPALPDAVELRARRIEDAEACELFRRAAVLVLPYRDATQSALVAAAYAFDLPVIVTDAGALSEYVVPGETGWVVPAGDGAALAAALREALADPARLHEMGCAGRAWLTAQREVEEAALAAMYAEVPRSFP